MAKQVQFRGGTTSEHSAFTGASREITVDTDKNTVVVHDGSTNGGFPLANVNANGNVAQAENALKLGGKSLEEVHPTIQNIKHFPSDWSYSTTSNKATVYGTTITLSKKSLVIASVTGHIKNNGSHNAHCAIDFGNNNLPANLNYPNYKGYIYGRYSEDWSGVSITQGEILEAGVHNINVVIGAENSGTAYLNGSALFIYIIEVGV